MYLFFGVSDRKDTLERGEEILCVDCKTFGRTVFFQLNDPFFEAVVWKVKSSYTRVLMSFMNWSKD